MTVYRFDVRHLISQLKCGKAVGSDNLCAEYFKYSHDIVLYCIMRPYTEGQLDRYRIGIPRELSEIRTQPWLSEGSLTCDPGHQRGPIF